MHDRLFDRGLVIVGVTGGELTALEGFAQQHEAHYPMAIGAYVDYAFDSIPYSVLIDPTGTVRWKGHPAELDDALLQEVLRSARPANVAAGLEEVARLLQQRQPGAAYGKARELLAAGTLSAAATAQAEQRVAELEADVAQGLAAADAALAAGDVHGAFRALAPLAEHTGVPGADAATRRRQAMLADRRQKREIDAGTALDTATALERERDYDAAFEAYRNVARAFSGTRAAKTATAAQQAIDKAGKRGFRRGCGACMAGDKTCSAHAKKRR